MISQAGINKSLLEGLRLTNKKFFFLTGFFLLCITALYGGGKKEKDVVVQITGTVRLVGSSLFPELVITGSDYEWYVAEDEINKLKDLQHRTVTVEGIETVIDLKFASGLPAGKRRELKKIKIISIQ
jgi:hypothetical protein